MQAQFKLQLSKGLIAASFAAVTLLAAAGAGAADGPPYWLKKYPDAPKAKQDECLKVAEKAYNDTLKSAPGKSADGFAREAMGKSWDACMTKK